MTPIDQDTTPSSYFKSTGPMDRTTKMYAWAWFAPLILVGVLQYLLGIKTQGLANVEPLTVAPFVSAPQGSEGQVIAALYWESSKYLLLTVVSIALFVGLSWLGVKRLGWKRMKIIFTVLWCLVWIGAAVVMVLRFVNRVGMTALPDAQTTVLVALPYPSTDNQPGGTRAWLMPTNGQNPDAVPWRVQLEGADNTALPKGSQVTLHLGKGALWGEFVTGSNAPLAKVDAPNKP